MQNLNVLPNVLPNLSERTSEKRESLKSRGNGQSDLQLNKVLTLSKMDQEILQNYKLRVQTLESELKNKKDELLSLSRNFDALCLKAKEDSNLIKKLEEELNFIKSKDKNPIRMSSSTIPKFDDDSIAYIKNYKEKVEYQTGVIKELENKLSTNSSRFNERDKFYKNYTTKLEEKTQTLTKTMEALEKEKITIKKDHDKSIKELEKVKTEFNTLIEENENLINKNKEMDNVVVNIKNELISKHEKALELKDSEYKNKLKCLNEQQKKIQLSQNAEEKLKNENEIFNKLITEVKLRNKSLEDNLNKATEQLMQKEQEIINFKQSLQNELLNIVDLFTKQESKYKAQIDLISQKMVDITKRMHIVFNKQIKEKVEYLINKHSEEKNELNILIKSYFNDIKKYKEASGDNAANIMKIKELEKIIHENKEEYDKLKPSLDEKDDLVKKLELKTKAYEVIERDLKESNSYKEEYMKKINKLEDTLRIKQKDINEYSLNIKEIEANERKIKSQNELYRNLLLTAEEKIKNFDVSQLENEKKLNSKISALENVIDQQKLDIEAIKKDYEYLKNKGSGVERCKEFFQQLISTNSKVRIIF